MQNNQYKSELNQLKKLISPTLWDLLSDNGCIIAGGAITSVFTNKEVNDIDVYFPSAKAFTRVVEEIYGSYTTGLESEYGMNIREAHAQHVTPKALLLQSDNQDVQLIGYTFYENAPAIFDAFDFSINMGALYMYDSRFSFDENFMKHNAQKYLHFNPSTTYPLVSALRVDKYRQRGYTISKAQMLRVLLAVNKKEINTWEKLMDELGGLYGTPPEEIFDTTKEFNLDDAIASLDNFEIKDYITTNNPTIDDVILKMPESFTEELVNKRKEYYNGHSWMTSPYDKEKAKDGSVVTTNIWPR